MRLCVFSLICLFFQTCTLAAEDPEGYVKAPGTARQGEFVFAKKQRQNIKLGSTLI